MIRPLTLVTMVAAMLAGMHVYQTKHEVALLDKELRGIAKAIENENERTLALSAEWAWLNEPDRLRQAAQRHLALEPMTPGQFVRYGEFERRLPQVAAFDGPPALFAARDHSGATPEPNGAMRIELAEREGPPPGLRVTLAAAATAATLPATRRGAAPADATPAPAAEPARSISASATEPARTAAAPAAEPAQATSTPAPEPARATPGTASPATGLAALAAAALPAATAATTPAPAAPVVTTAAVSATPVAATAHAPRPRPTPVAVAAAPRPVVARHAAADALPPIAAPAPRPTRSSEPAARPAPAPAYAAVAPATPAGSMLGGGTRTALAPPVPYGSLPPPVPFASASAAR